MLQLLVSGRFASLGQTLGLVQVEIVLVQHRRNEWGFCAMFRFNLEVTEDGIACCA
ncbi:predicted protein [Plenodomus lingam JN3]|uniref:Predicted protein n=1 Tax=Leptosphaeria maculans (strain JN3 / isolate v23.1.3 / race Av1-4-5-6-7-8) TaxID=985895 RepID=E4ZYW9_LEPMJ|nr:predicted protein [Plenodomus lingam JN3]CBX96404.1 predicted protein [Plenodomus lingam JN3]